MDFTEYLDIDPPRYWSFHLALLAFSWSHERASGGIMYFVPREHKKRWDGISGNTYPPLKCNKFTYISNRTASNLLDSKNSVTIFFPLLSCCEAHVTLSCIFCSWWVVTKIGSIPLQISTKIHNYYMWEYKYLLLQGVDLFEQRLS